MASPASPEPATTETIVRMEGVSKVYGSGHTAVHALDDVDLEVRRGELLVLLGPSGSGKTTLLNMIGGIESPTGGEVSVAGAELERLDEQERTEFRRETVGFIFQFFNLIPTLTAAENVELIAELTVADAAESAKELLAEVGLGDRGHHYPAELSGGEQQRVAVARALAGRPMLLLGDEPTGALDLETGRLVLELIRRVNREHGLTVLLVTHNAAIGRMADRVLRMRDGRITTDEANPSPVSPAELDW